LITAGGTREPIDPVRFIGNRSSGKMGMALAQAAAARGARVILVTTAAVEDASPLEQIRVTTAEEMQLAVMKRVAEASVVVMAAAVADYRVKKPAAQKLKKQDTLVLELEKNDDILQQVVAQKRAGTIVIGFASETERVVEEGRRKLRDKGADAIVANDVSRSDRGFEVDWNAGTLLMRDSEVYLPPSSKREMAERILDHVSSIRSATVALEF